MPVDNDQLMDKLSEFHAEFTEFRGEMKVRIAHVEKEQADAKFWENVKVFCVLPVIAGLHQVGIHFKWLRG
jgi:hypothetical protein